MPAAMHPQSTSAADAGTQQQTNQLLLLLNDGTDGWTERQTPDRYTDPAPHTMRAVSTTEQQSTNQKQQSL